MLFFAFSMDAQKQNKPVDFFMIKPDHLDDKGGEDCYTHSADRDFARKEPVTHDVNKREHVKKFSFYFFNDVNRHIAHSTFRNGIADDSTRGGNNIFVKHTPQPCVKNGGKPPYFL